MIRDLGGPADGAEKNRVMPADLSLPVLGHHAGVLFIVLDAGEIEPVEREVETMLPGGCFERAHAFGRHLLADAVAGYYGDAIGFHVRAPRTRKPVISDATARR